MMASLVSSFDAAIAAIRAAVEKAAQKTRSSGTASSVWQQAASAKNSASGQSQTQNTNWSPDGQAYRDAQAAAARRRQEEQAAAAQQAQNQEVRENAYNQSQQGRSQNTESENKEQEANGLGQGFEGSTSDLSPKFERLDKTGTIVKSTDPNGEITPFQTALSSLMNPIGTVAGLSQGDGIMPVHGTLGYDVLGIPTNQDIVRTEDPNGGSGGGGLGGQSRTSLDRVDRVVNAFARGPFYMAEVVDTPPSFDTTHPGEYMSGVDVNAPGVDAIPASTTENGELFPGATDPGEYLSGVDVNAPRHDVNIDDRSEAEKAADALNAQLGDPLVGQGLVDENGNPINLQDLDQLTGSNLVLKKIFGDEHQDYGTLTDLQINGTRDDWHALMTDPLSAGMFVDRMSGFIEDPAQLKAYQDALSTGDFDPVRQIMEDAFNRLWDTQKAVDIDEFINGGGDQDAYMRTFDADGVAALADYIANTYTGASSLSPSVKGSLLANAAETDPNSSLWTEPLDLNGTVSPVSIGGMLQRYEQEGLDRTPDIAGYLTALENVVAPLANGITAEDPEGKNESTAGYLDDEELAEIERMMMRQSLANRYLTGLYTPEDAARMGVDQDWEQLMNPLGRHEYISNEWLQEHPTNSEGTNYLDNGLIWDIGGDQTFEEQNPLYGSDALGYNYVDLDAIQKYANYMGFPILAGDDQLWKRIGFKQADKGILG